MKKLIAIWLGEVSSRFQEVAKISWYGSLGVGLMALISLIGVTQPSYSNVSLTIYHYSLVTFIISSCIFLLPTKEYINYATSISLADETVRTGFINKVGAAVKDITKDKVQPMCLYSKYIQEKYLKYVYIILYVWDLRKLRPQFKVTLYTCYAALIALSVNYLLSSVTSSLYFDAAVKDLAIAGIVFFLSTALKLMFVPSLDTVKQLLVVYIIEKLNKMELGRNVEE